MRFDFAVELRLIDREHIAKKVIDTFREQMSLENGRRLLYGNQKWSAIFGKALLEPEEYFPEFGSVHLLQKQYVPQFGNMHPKRKEYIPQYRNVSLRLRKCVPEFCKAHL